MLVRTYSRVSQFYQFFLYIKLIIMLIHMYHRSPPWKQPHSSFFSCFVPCPFLQTNYTHKYTHVLFVFPSDSAQKHTTIIFLNQVINLVCPQITLSLSVTTNDSKPVIFIIYNHIAFLSQI